MTNPAEPIAKTQAEADMRRLAKIGSIAALVGVAVIVAAMLAGLGLLSLIDPFVKAVTTLDGGLFWTTGLAALHQLAPLIPIGFYLTAVLGALRILDRISEGQYFSETNIRTLGEMGGSMLWGAGWTVFLVPALSDWTAGIVDYRVDFRPEPLVIGTIGLCLLVLGRLLLRAQKLEADMAEIV